MYQVIVADPPWPFSDKLTMSKTKRGAESQYGVLSVQDIKELKVTELAASNSVLALWCPSSLLREGLDTMESWGFNFKQTHIWVKVKQKPLLELHNSVRQFILNNSCSFIEPIYGLINGFNLNSVLSFGMGRLFRQTHEVVLIGVRGSIYKELQNKSQRSVHLSPALKHSAKPELLQDYLEKMFPNGKKLELFARRDRANWVCVGDECVSTFGEDIRVSLDRLINENSSS